MVLTNLLISCGFPGMVKSLIRKPFESVFHLNANLASAYILGIISGYPQGAYAIAEIYDKGGCTQDEAERALAFCNNTGPAFAVGAAGSLWGDGRSGWMLFFLQCALSLLYGILTRPKKASVNRDIGFESSVGLDVIPKAVTGSVLPMLNICAFVIIFSLVCSWISLLPLNIGIKAFVFSFLEISNAVKFICGEYRSLPLLAATLLWSGLCVHMQTSAVVSGRFSMKRYYIGKVIQAVSVFLILYLKKATF